MHVMFYLPVDTSVRINVSSLSDTEVGLFLLVMQKVNMVSRYRQFNNVFTAVDKACIPRMGGGLSQINPYRAI